MFSQVQAADTLKVGIVDLLKSLNDSEKGKKAKAELESLIKSKQLVIDEKGKGLDKLKADLDKQASIISAEARKTKEEELERQVRDYQRTVSDSQAEVKKKEGELTGEILKEIRGVIQQLAQEDGYSIVLEKAEGIILYSDKSLDITEKVVKRYNQPAKK
ncbi:MAG: OmpH family outer membrane protein [Nitrospirales bacterium]|nr:OmpH family outer membrane protein [Nitrospirales bacterium]